MIDASCSACGHVVRANDEQVGKLLSCPRCGGPVPVGDVAPDELAAARAASSGTARAAAHVRRSAGHALVVGVGLAAAVAGAFAWAYVMRRFDAEYSLVAWALGGLLGLAMVAAGAGGRRHAMLAAALALAAIAGGKLLGASWVYTDELEAFLASRSTFTVEQYEEALADAAALQGLSVADDEALRGYMVERGFTDAGDPAGVEHHELDDFRAFWQPHLEELAATPPSYADWRRARQDEVREQFAEDGPVALALETLGPMDVMFFGLGIYSAYALVARREERGDPTARWLRRR